MIRDRDHLFWSMWASKGWATRERGTLGCWAQQGGVSFFDNVFSGSRCHAIDWQGEVPGPHSLSTGAPALLGHDPAILELCLRKLGRWRKVWFAPNEELAKVCLEANENVMRVKRNQWNICVNFEYISCASGGHLPNQGSAKIHLATAPRDMRVEDISQPGDRYRMEDVTYFEYCLLSEMCENGDQLFHVGPGGTFTCRRSQASFSALRDLLMGLDT
jgi:hypothetical protein